MALTCERDWVDWVAAAAAGRRGAGFSVRGSGAGWLPDIAQGLWLGCTAPEAEQDGTRCYRQPGAMAIGMMVNMKKGNMHSGTANGQYKYTERTRGGRNAEQI